MKRVLYITTTTENPCDGVWKKIISNLVAYKKLGFAIDFLFSGADGFYIAYNYLDDDEERIKIAMINRNFVFYAMQKYIKHDYDLVYIRKPHGGANSLFLNGLLKKIRHNPKTKCVLEIPTYPYFKEVKTVKLAISEMLLFVSRLIFKNKIDLITYMGEKVDTIWGRPALQIANGVDLDEITLLREQLTKNSDTVELLGVAKLAFWHGYDRLIKALADYRGDTKIVFKIVGDGATELKRLKKIAKSYQLTDRVIFLGPLYGEALNNQYLASSICVDSLGRHRSGNIYNNSLKSKEYTAKGIPFIKAHLDDSFQDNPAFIYNISANEDPIDISDIVAWYNALDVNTPVIMRNYAQKHLSWEKQLRKITEKLGIM
ncbi:glycosyltransferase [Orbaceae bacterium ESL0721]|nr:glycosyltransferase [Orbaceae bacterium ESL0721]